MTPEQENDLRTREFYAQLKRHLGEEGLAFLIRNLAWALQLDKLNPSAYGLATDLVTIYTSTEPATAAELHRQDACTLYQH